ncbi:vasoactive intestinal polypeptide receptor 2-like [Anneissia japonica]|uniref:vasoactive intestinal polypeptide receptor 2-like n=1 Tax=Anneissia japonica TaxID=1529436 RepID=UPI0014257194|nr:vasoactive intestinal polypeptide receptor 2-like [Anneissia japonica]
MIVPMLLLLAVNVFFLTMILKVLLPKIKTSGQNNIRNHLKMLKSAVVLVVLLGTVYIVFLIEPQIKNVTPLAKYVMSVINTTLQVTQGLAVAILYVFMNSDVQTKVSTEARRFSDRRLSSIKGLSMRQNGSTSVRAKLNRRLMHLRLRSDSRQRSSLYANNKTQTFSVSESSSNDANGGIHIARITDLNSNGGIPRDSATECNDEHHSDDVFQETSLIQIDNNTNGHAKLLEESGTGEKLSEEEELSQALLIDVHL